jgi:hypothetical protein
VLPLHVQAGICFSSISRRSYDERACALKSPAPTEPVAEAVDHQRQKLQRIPP